MGPAGWPGRPLPLPTPKPRQDGEQSQSRVPTVFCAGSRGPAQARTEGLCSGCSGGWAGTVRELGFVGSRGHAIFSAHTHAAAFPCPRRMLLEGTSGCGRVNDGSELREGAGESELRGRQAPDCSQPGAPRAGLAFACLWWAHLTSGAEEGILLLLPAWPSPSPEGQALLFSLWE